MKSKTLFVAVICASSIAALSAQGRGQQPAPPRVARDIAPIDLTGYWVSVVNKDWRWRMVTPAKGDFVSIPLNAEGTKVGLTWDPEKDEAAGEQCRTYGAAGLMRVPGRLHITWQDDNTLKVETDAGMQTRLLRFGPRTGPAGRPSWQGDSVAQWVGMGAAARGEAAGPRFGSLEVMTKNMRPGYLRRNGVPYSANAVLTEYWDLYKEPGTDWLVISTTVEDAAYLQIPYLTSPAFKREPDGSKWDPTPCSASW